MREESVCRICFNLLNDIDYHLKEAQEKTDEITAKFLDKEKDRRPVKQLQDVRFSCSPHTMSHYIAKITLPIFSRPVSKIKKSKVVTNSGARPGGPSSSHMSRTIQTDRGPDQEVFRSRSPSHVPVRGGGKGQSFYRRVDHPGAPTQPISPPWRAKGERSKRRQSPEENLQERGYSSPEAASVSPGLAEKKRKLLSKVLGSGRKKRVESEESEEEENRLTIDMEERGREEKKEKERKRRDKKRRRKERSLRKERERRERRASMVMRKEEEEEEEERVSGESDLDLDSSSPLSPPAPAHQMVPPPSTPSPRKAADIRTVDLAQLGDLFSVTAPPDTMAPPQVVTHTITLAHPPVNPANIITVHPGNLQVTEHPKRSLNHKSPGTKQSVCQEEFPCGSSAYSAGPPDGGGRAAAGDTHLPTAGGCPGGRGALLHAHGDPHHRLPAPAHPHRGAGGRGHRAHRGGGQ